MQAIDLQPPNPSHSAHQRSMPAKPGSPLELRGKPCNVGYILDNSDDLLAPSVSWNAIKNITGRNSTTERESRWKLMHPGTNNVQWIDERTIYNLKETSLLSEHEFPPVSRPLTCDPMKGGSIKGDRGRELTYVIGTFNNLASRDPAERSRFSSHTLRDYKRALPLLKRQPSYGIPASADNAKPPKIADVVLSMMKSRNSTEINASRFKDKHCGQNSVARCQFCEVLGPATCYACIETTNRKAVQDAQRHAFDYIECNTTMLVAPKLAELFAGKSSSAAHESRPQTTNLPSIAKKDKLWNKVKFAISQSKLKE